MKKITFTLSTLQFITLLKLVYLGQWIANAFRTGEDTREDYATTEQLIFTLAQSTGFSAYVYHHDKCGKLHVTDEFLEDTGVDSVRMEYDEDLFWDELIQRLSKRDLEDRLGSDAVQAMSDTEYQSSIRPYLERWTEEVKRHGIDRLHISPSYMPASVIQRQLH